MKKGRRKSLPFAWSCFRIVWRSPGREEQRRQGSWAAVPSDHMDCVVTWVEEVSFNKQPLWGYFLVRLHWVVLAACGFCPLILSILPTYALPSPFCSMPCHA